MDPPPTPMPKDICGLRRKTPFAEMAAVALLATEIGTAKFGHSLLEGIASDKGTPIAVAIHFWFRGTTDKEDGHKNHCALLHGEKLPSSENQASALLRDVQLPQQPNAELKLCSLSRY
jgi:hypothetical protein